MVSWNRWHPPPPIRYFSRKGLIIILIASLSPLVKFQSDHRFLVAKLSPLSPYLLLTRSTAFLQAHRVNSNNKMVLVLRELTLPFKKNRKCHDQTFSTELLEFVGKTREPLGLTDDPGFFKNMFLPYLVVNM